MPKTPKTTSPAGCQYLSRQDGVLRECGAPARWKGNRARGLLYCNTCAAYVRRQLDLRPLQDYEIRALLASAPNAQN